MRNNHITNSTEDNPPNQDIPASWLKTGALYGNVAKWYGKALLMLASGVQFSPFPPLNSKENIMNSKTKGQLSEARALYEFQKYHIPVCLPWGDNERYDMVAEFDEKFNRIQVKTSNEEENGAICCWARSSTNHTTNKNLSSYEGEVDYFVFVNQTHDLIALVSIEELEGKKSIRLRLTPPANGQTKGIRYFSDYSFDKKFGIVS